MAITLPYDFDTTYIGKLVFKAATVLSGILTVGVLKFVVIGDLISTFITSVLAGIIFFYALLIFKKIGGATGTITRSEVTVQPATFLGFSSGDPQGTFALSQFSALCVTWRPRVGSPGEQMSPGNNEDVLLVGQPGTPDIEIARFTDGTAKVFAEELGALLGLKVEVKAAPGVHAYRKSI